MPELDLITRWAAIAATEIRVFPDHERTPLANHSITYKRANNVDLTLTVVTAGPESELRPTVIYIHGGGWVHLSKEDRFFFVLPYLARGMNAVHLEYRTASQSLAPAAVEDCRCALRWICRHAQEYGIDTEKLVLIGESAGGHLALMTGLLDPGAGFDRACAWSLGQDAVKVAAIVNYFGITDVLDVLEGPNQRLWALEWFGSLPNRIDLARQLSPLNYVRPGVPPIVTVHGARDAAVPYNHAVRLHEALDRVGVPNKLITIPEGAHGQRRFSRAENVRSQAEVFEFLDQRHLGGVIPQP